MGKRKGSQDAEPERRLGALEPKHQFFLNPYQDARFTCCPGCAERMRTRKEPFLIHVDPMELVVLNMTARYCPRCDLLILHKDVVEDLLVRVFETRKPELIGNDYLVLGILERSYWRKHKDSASGTVRETLQNLHEFKKVVIYEPEHYGWVPDEEAKDKEGK